MVNKVEIAVLANLSLNVFVASDADEGVEVGLFLFPALLLLL